MTTVAKVRKAGRLPENTSSTVTRINRKAIDANRLLIRAGSEFPLHPKPSWRLHCGDHRFSPVKDHRDAGRAQEHIPNSFRLSC